MRTLVTGGNGFVGRHLVARLREDGGDVLIAGRAHDGDVDLPLDLTDEQNVRGVVEIAKPDRVYHLAAQAFVPEATRDPIATYDVNAIGTARLYEALRELDSKPRVLYVSSAEVFGIREPREYPIAEDAAARPATPYAASKLAGEAIALASGRTYGIPTIVTRAFNHIGPGQSDRFAVASFAAQLAAIAAGGPSLLLVGNLKAERDFLDVRDVVRAYATVLENGAPGEVYNVCSGTPVSMQEILRKLVMIARVAVEIREDPERMRPSDIPVAFGNNAKLKSATGWIPDFSLDASLRDIYADAQARVAVSS
jgi:GDP-4-dehydro-6-deoxy-D-mannose reductase